MDVPRRDEDVASDAVEPVGPAAPDEPVEQAGPTAPEATIPAGAAIPTPADDVSTGSAPDPSRRRRRRWTLANITGAATLIGTVIALVALLNDFDVFTPPAPVPTTAAPTPNPEPTGAVPGFELFDDFSGPGPDPARWSITDPAGLFSVADGSLRAAVGPDGGGTEATLTARPDRTVTGVSFRVRIAGGTGPSVGGLYLILYTDSAQQQRIVEVCHTARCDDGVVHAISKPAGSPELLPGPNTVDRRLEIGRDYGRTSRKASTFAHHAHTYRPRTARGPVDIIRIEPKQSSDVLSIHA